MVSEYSQRGNEDSLVISSHRITYDTIRRAYGPGMKVSFVGLMSGRGFAETRAEVTMTKTSDALQLN
jgi:hypothetical protein